MISFGSDRSRHRREHRNEIPDSDEERNTVGRLTEAPATQKSATDAQTAKEPVAEERVVEAPAVEAPAFEAPAVERPAEGSAVVVELNTISAAAREEFRTVPVEEDDVPEVQDDSDDSFVEADADDSESDHPPRLRAQSRRKPARRGRGPRGNASNDELTVHNGSLQFKDAPIELTASLGRLARETPRIAKQTQRWLTNRRPMVPGLSDVQALLPRIPLGPHWTVKDRDTVDRDWARYYQRDQLLNVTGNKELLTLYKCSLRLMRCLPEDIISCRFDLAYDVDQKRALTRGQRPVWGAPFCRSLTALMVHPMWNGSTAPLAAAIQYAVIVDTNDNGPWDMEVRGHDSFLTELLKRKRLQPDRNAVELRRQLHKELSASELDKFGRNTGVDPSRWDALFRAIEKMAKSERLGKPPAPQAVRGTSEPFLVHHRHLELIEKGLDSMVHMGFPYFLPLDVYGRGIHGRRSAKDYPLAKDLPALREYSIICERERLAYKAKLAKAARGTLGNPPADGTQANSEVVNQTSKEPEVPNTQHRDELRVPHIQEDEGAGTPLQDEGIPETQYTLRGQKRQRPSETNPTSSDNPQKRARSENPLSPQKRAQNQLLLRTLSESPGGCVDIFDMDTAPTVSRRVNESPIGSAQTEGQDMELGKGDDAPQQSQLDDENNDASVRGNAGDENVASQIQHDDDDEITSPEADYNPRWYLSHSTHDADDNFFGYQERPAFRLPPLR